MSCQLTLLRGNTNDILVTVLINGDPLYPYDLAAISEIIFNVKQTTDPAEAPLIQKKFTLGQIMVISPTTLGQYSIQLSPADVDLFNQLRSYWVDSQITDPTGTFTVVSTSMDFLYILTKE